MCSRNKEDVKKLFEYWCEVTRSTDHCEKSAGIIVESFPESFRDEQIIAKIPDFAYPCEFENESVQSYSFVLTSDDSKWRFGFCRHDPKTASAMIIITYLPWHDTFLKLLTVLAELRRIGNGDFATFLSEAYNRGVPDPGGNLKLFFNSGLNHFVFERPLQFQLPSIPENHNLNLYYNFVDPKNMIAVFAAMLAERRLIFTSRRLDRLSSCIQAANAFLYPMVWQHIFIPVLPMKLKDILSAPMPYLIGVPEAVLETMTPEELGEVVILNCDTKIFESPFDDVHEMPPEIISQLKKHLSHSHEHIGDRVSKIFLCVLVQLIGGYRDAVEFGTGKTFNREKFVESRPHHLRPFLSKMMELQIFQQFIDERLEMLNTGLGFSDEFELETVRYAEKIKKRGRNYAFLRNVKDKTNPAVKSAVKSVKEGSRGVKTAYKDLKSKFRDITPPKTNFRSHVSSSHHDGIGGGLGVKHHGPHSAPSSPIFNKRSGGGFAYASPEAINGATTGMRKPLAMSSSNSQIQQNGYANFTSSAPTYHSHLGASSPTVSPAGSICSSEMNLSQELQNHPLFKSPTVDRTLKPSSSLDLNCRNAARPGAPVRPPPPTLHSYLSSSSSSSSHLQQQKQAQLSSSYYKNSSHASQTLPSLHHLSQPVAKLPAVPRNRTTSNTNTSTSTVTATATAVNHNNNNLKIVTTESIYDNPPEMLSPPVPPRRNTPITVVDGGIGTPRYLPPLSNNERKWFGLTDVKDSPAAAVAHKLLLNGGPHGYKFLPLSSSPRSNDPPIPAPRLKKESLRSLQQQHYLQPPSVPPPAPPTISISQDETMNDLISLDDSSNASFDLEDFDPLNQNAKPLPTLGAGGGQGTAKSTTLPLATMVGSSVSNPLYPYFAPQQRNTLPASKGSSPPANNIAPNMQEDDYELLRKYGLDQFTLTATAAAEDKAASIMSIHHTNKLAATKTLNNNNSSSNKLPPNMNNWTIFD